ncbi:zinc finger protein zfs1 [Cryptomeria japonica]|uniref:zinc finger protein zfs1 n=1 Tax=Cryptomeria japonica TaxID=3369 RepID=UPI0025AC9CC2|nr:zinc finger protein zfs1 [Cryptomeria japonica]
MSKHQRLPLVPISSNAYLSPAFNACIEPLDLHLQELDPGLLRSARTGNENISPHSKYYSSLQNQLTKATSPLACTAHSSMIVTPWSPEPPGASRSNLASPENFDKLLSLSPPSCFSPSRYITPLQKPVPRFKLSTFTPAQLEEDVLVIDGIAINKSSTIFFSTPESCRKQKSTSSDSFASGSTSSSSGKSLYKTEICRSWEEYGTCRYGLKCQFAHGKDELRTAIRHPKYKTEICRAFTATGTCPYGARCRFIHHFSLTNNYGEDFNFSTDLEEILNASQADFEEMLSAVSLNPCSTGNRILRKRLPIFEEICPTSPPPAD